ncbi:hypothetical protein B9G98_01949 [Wickerhamiella sorbophila]|uniref:Uncharacterized protein n=1 Tax=Wickerhamiella sorbophila TaxID=45607 RepID=A0A2T0FHB1_9ASCO|nr:hypothetical protein B9G98_01949 [Wickerhamiella sorbophila]PRT54329.1 hypothetical protein B9G98_01949 [Wickerhamiella sorbophila]
MAYSNHSQSGSTSSSGSVASDKVFYDINQNEIIEGSNASFETEDLAPLAVDHIFQNAEKCKTWNAVYKKAQYEGLHHFDPTFVWTKKEERSVLLRTELRVTFVAFLLFVALDIDRYNMANATAGTILKDLKLTTNDYNLGSTVNLVCFLASELPSQLLSKKIGPDRWIPIQLTAWSLVATFQCFMQNKAGFLVCRGLLGALQGGFIPDVSLWISYFYTNSEMSTRLGYFYIANPLTQALASLLSYGIFSLHGHSGWAGWRWVFMIEGLITLVLGISAFFLMPPSVTQTKVWFRPNGWYTERQEKILVNRVLRDDPSKGDMHNREALTFGMIWKSITDYDLWPVYVCRLLTDIIGTPISKYQAILYRSQGFSTMKTNLLMIPPNILTIFTLLASVHLSKWSRQFAYVYCFSALWWIPCLAAMRWWPGFLHNVWGSYALIFIGLGAPPDWPLSISWVSANSYSVRTRTVSGALVNIASQLAAIIGANIFRKDDAPRYQRGVKQLFGIAVTSFFVPFLVKCYYMARNNWKSRKWANLSLEDQAEYDHKNVAEGNKRLDFLFVH